MSGNGRTKAAMVSAGAAVIGCVLLLSGWWAGRETKIRAGAARDYALDEVVKTQEAKTA